MKTTNEKLTEALTYFTNQRPGLEAFMEDSRLPLSNNLCEASIKPYATARRAWLFADTPRGANANAILYTLAESARANKLDVYEYLKYLLTEMPNNSHLEHPDVIDQYLPWSKELPDECRLEHKHKKCLKNDEVSITDFLSGYTTPCFEALTKGIWKKKRNSDTKVS